MVKPKLLYQVVWVTALRMFSCALMSAVFIPDSGFIYRSSALYQHFSCFCRDFSWWPSSYECSASNVWYCIKSFQLFLNLQGSSNNNEIDHVYLTFLVSIAIFMQTTKGKNEKERLQQQEWIQQRLNLQLHDHSLSLVIIRQMPWHFKLLKMKIDLLSFLYLFLCSHSYGCCLRLAAVYHPIADV